MIRLFILVCIFSWSSQVLANSKVVVVDQRMQPGRDLSTETISEATITFKVLNDRGIIKQSEGRLSHEATPVLVSTLQSFRTITGPINTDGSFKSEVTFQKRDFHMTGPDGKRQVIPENPTLVGVKVGLVIDSTGKIRDDSLVISGMESRRANDLRGTLVSLIEQITLIPPIQLSENQFHQQVHTLEIPVPGIDTIRFNVTVTSKLLGVVDGIALISEAFDFNLLSPDKLLNVRFDGKGEGSQHYNIEKKLLSQQESTQTIRFTIDSPLGLVEGNMEATTRQRTRFTPLGVFR
ncbi:MAG: hypothetical protein AB1516_11970 [Pseudomonadota bacterium]